MTLTFISTLVARYLLVILFFPFSALDKIFNFEGAVQQASSIVPQKSLAILLILVGLMIELTMPMAILTGLADRMAGLVLASYCVVTACLWKQFWIPGDFWCRGDSKARTLFWDFLKNFSLAGGFLLLVIGTQGSLNTFLSHPLSSSHPYTRGEAP